jgi:hypothetical protein
MDAPHIAFEKGVSMLANGATAEKLPIYHLFEAYAAGTGNMGDKLLCETLAVITKWTSSWGALAVLVLGMVYIVVLVKQGAGALWAKVKKLTEFLSPFAALKNFFSSVFADGAAPDNPEAAFGGLTQLVSLQVPLVGLMLGTMASDARNDIAYDIAYDGEAQRTISGQLQGAGFDIVETMFDSSGQEVSVDDVPDGESLFDDKGNEYVVQGDELVPA